MTGVRNLRSSIGLSLNIFFQGFENFALFTAATQGIVNQPREVDAVDVLHLSMASVQKSTNMQKEPELSIFDHFLLPSHNPLRTRTQIQHSMG